MLYECETKIGIFEKRAKQTIASNLNKTKKKEALAEGLIVVT